MLKKVTFGRRDTHGDLYFVTQYKLFGVTLYERAVFHRLFEQHGAAVQAL